MIDATAPEPTMNVPFQQFQEEWARCLPWLQATYDYWPNQMTMDEVYQAVARGQMQFWPGPSAAVVTQVNETNHGRELYVVLAGGNIGTLEHMFYSIERFAQIAECKFITMFGRIGWLRRFPMKVGFKQTGIVLQKELDHVRD